MCQKQHFIKCIKCLLHQQLTKLSVFTREPGEFLSLFISLLLLTVADVACCTLVLKFVIHTLKLL